MNNLLPLEWDFNNQMDNRIVSSYREDSNIILFHGDCMDLLRTVPDKSVQLVVTSPPYNIGKEYEKRLETDDYLARQEEVITECVRVLQDSGSICWQVGNRVENGAIVPLDTLLYPIFVKLGLVLRNRIVWSFEHGLHCSRRFSGRYETIIWFTKETKNYVFNLDPVRIPQKYPGKKYFKGSRAGQYSCNPLGKNPGDVWDIPNVKNNHIEKTEHPCQFPVGLIDRVVLSMSNEGDLVFDPFLGAGTSIVSALQHSRRGMGAEIQKKYIDISRTRIEDTLNGTIRIRPMNKPKYNPHASGNKLTQAPWLVG